MQLKALLKSTTIKPPLLFLAVIVLSFGIYIPWLGLYGDDWQYLYVFHLLGAGEYPAFVAPDRPFSAWIYQLYTPLLGETVWAYHALILLLRWFSALAFWWVLSLLWPAKTRNLTWVVIFFCVYPGFKQQALPLEFILHFTVMLMTFLSLGLMLKAQHTVDKWRRWSLTIAGVLLGAGMFSVEYFIGLELMRPILLWFNLREKGLSKGKRLKVSLVTWLPYLLVAVLFFVWRVFIFSFQFYEPAVLDRILANPAKGIFQLFWKVLSDLWLLIVKVWSQAFAQSNAYIHIIISVGLFVLFFIIVFWLVRLLSDAKSDSSAPGTSEEQWATQALLLGAAALLFAGWPFWLVDVPIQSGFPWDRPSLAFMPGAALLWTGLLVLIVQPRARVWIISGLVSLAMVFHYQNAVSYINEWKEVKQFFQQLIWRVPELEENTFLLTDGIPFLYYGDNTLSPALNWVYAPDLHLKNIPYRAFDLNIRRQTTFKEVGRDMPVEHNYRSFKFSGNTDSMIAFKILPDQCLRILGPEDQNLPGIPDQLGDLLYLSRKDLIANIPEPTVSLPHVFGSQVAKDWCYYFQKAELAGQFSEWDKVVDLYREAGEKGFQPYSPDELAIFMKGLIITGDLETARQVAQQVVTDDLYRTFACESWQNAVDQTEMTPASQQQSQAIFEELGCFQ